MPPSAGKHSFVSTEGDPFEVRVPSAADIDSFFVFSFPRCGSTLLDRMLRQLCDGVAIPYITIADDAFASGVQVGRMGKQVESLLSRRGFAYLGFRSFFEFDPTFDFSGLRKVVLVRDPRDMLVSLYFSIKHSHSIPKRGTTSWRMRGWRGIVRSTGIDDFLAGSQGDLYLQMYRHTLERYRRFLFDNQLRLYRYEDVIFEKPSWLHDLTTYLSIPASQALMDRVVEDNDVLPKREYPKSHIRQVHPGNYLRHLSDQSIAKVNDTLSEELEFFGYAP